MNNRCLFCTKWATAACCLACRDTTRSTMFEILLALFGKAAIANDYYDQIKFISQQIETLDWLLAPIQFTPITHFDPAIHTMDQQAQVYLRRGSMDVRDMIPVEVVGNGNCLYNSIICLAGSTFLTPSELRVRTLLELLKNETLYSNRFTYSVGTLDETLKNISRNFSYSDLYEIAGLTNVLKCNIRSVYPEIDYRSDLHTMNNTFYHDSDNISSSTIYIFWTCAQNEMSTLNENSGYWSPNHFVPLLFSSNNSKFQNNLLPPTIARPNITPTKETTKNSTSTQVRVPQFDLERDEEQSLRASVTDSVVRKKISTDPLNKRKQSSLVHYTDMEMERVQNQRILARERMATKRAEATPDEVERQRVLARERSATRRAQATPEEAEHRRALTREENAARRAQATPEEAEHQRVLARERSAARRAQATPEEAEHQRVLARERSAARRAQTTPDEVERQRVLARERSAARRAQATPEEAEHQRVLARERSAARRAQTTPDEVERQRVLARERSAARRAQATPEEAEHQRILARERSMAKRAIASPKDAEIQRKLACERTAARRIVVQSKEVEQQPTTSTENHHQKVTKRKELSTQRKQNKDVESEWPKPPEINCKVNCLKNFIRDMSMSSLSEGVCGICNVRCYKRLLRRVPLTKIPSVELLKAHDDLCGIVPGIPQTNNLDSNTKDVVDDDLGQLVAEYYEKRDKNTQSSMIKRSFICINGVVFYERGLHRNAERRKRFQIHCDICMECWSSLEKEKIPKFSVANKVWMGDVPKELQELTIPEQRLIALYRHNSCIVKLHSSFHSADTAQTALKGNCINFPQDVVNIATTLPLEVDSLCDSLKILFVGHQIPERNQLKNILSVRRQKVSKALQWLIQNNPLYRNVRINQVTIDKLPDDEVPECLWTTMQVSTDVNSGETERASYIPNLLTNTTESSYTGIVPLITSGVLDINGTNVSSHDVTEHLLKKVTAQIPDNTFTTDAQKNIAGDTVYIVPRGNKPANEYFNPELLLGIFPTLFPYGCGALEDNSRPVKINFREHIKYLLSYQDRRFEENSSFMFVTFNILQRRSACFHAHLITTRPYFQESAQLIESLSSTDIATALVSISKGLYAKVTDPRIDALIKHIKVVGGHVMGSAHSRSALRTKIHSLCFSLGLPSLFITINPADIHSPVALYFAGVDLNLDKILPEELGTSYKRAQIIATHPVATAKFFNCLIKSILKCLVLGGILGPTKAYFGTVESQGRGSLHLHLLIWLNHEFTPAQLKDQIQNKEFRENLLKYLEDIIKEDLDLFRDDENNSTDDNVMSTEEIESKESAIIPSCLPTPNPSAKDFLQKFRKDVVRIVETCNIHKHSPTCYKYSKEKSDELRRCRMRMPRALVDISSIDPSTGQITMRRSHPWINNFNEWLISACRSNMDIKFIWSGNDAKALVYYITDYVTKSSLSFYDMFALAQQGIKSIEQQRGTNQSESAIEKSRKLVLRCYNTIASHQEVSGVQVASYLMNYGDHYTTHTFKNLFLISIENYLQTELIKAQQNGINLDKEQFNEIATSFYEDEEEEVQGTEEQFILEPIKNGSGYVMINTRLDYQHRSKDLTTVCLYDFVSQYHKKIIDKSDRRILKGANEIKGERLYTNGTKMNERHSFESTHPQSSSHLLIKRTSPIVPVLVGPQIPRRDREETRERYCRALLTLFVPWRSVYDICTPNQTWSEALEIRKSSITTDALKIIENIQLLHECKNDRDEHLLQVIKVADSNESIDRILIPSCYEENNENQEDDPEEILEMLSFINETTTKAYSASLSNHEQRYLHDALETIDKTKRFLLLNDYTNALDKSSCCIKDDLNTFVPTQSHHAALIKEWKRDIDVRKDRARNYLIGGEDTLQSQNDETQMGAVATDIFTSPYKSRINTIPSVTTAIVNSFPIKSDIIGRFTLNAQQKFAFMIITNHLDDENQCHSDIAENHLLMCVPGCGGTGKSQLIRAITNYFQVTKRCKLLRKLAPTSIAAAEIDGLTIHSFLGESRKVSKKKQPRTYRPGDMKLENEWRHVKYLIIDEMSMVGLSLLARLNRVVKTAKHTNSDIPFGGVNVIFFGDYLQYSPVLDKPLYQNYTSPQQCTERHIEMQCAQRIISQISCVVELNQQMRTEDVRYLDLLNRLRSGQSTIEDYQLLCTRIIGTPGLTVCLQHYPWNEAPILVFRNTLRTQINNRAVLNKALEIKCRPIVCVAQDYIKGSLIDDSRLRKAILELPDNKTEHLPGYLPLVPGMPVLLTQNIATELGLSNGTRGIFRQLVYDESSVTDQLDQTVFPDDTKFIMQPKYALVEFLNCKLNSALSELDHKVVPITVSEQTFLFDVKDLLTESVSKAAKVNKRTTKISVKRKALPLIPAYSITTHKSQGQTLNKIVIDLVMPPGPIEVASAYVPLSRVKRLDDLVILRPFEFANLQVKPSVAQLEELNRLNHIAENTRKRYSSIV